MRRPEERGHDPADPPADPPRAAGAAAQAAVNNGYTDISEKVIPTLSANASDLIKVFTLIFPPCQLRRDRLKETAPMV